MRIRRDYSSGGALAVFLSLAVTVLFLPGCKRPPEEDANRIVYSIWGSAAEEEVKREIVDAFMEKHPEIEVEDPTRAFSGNTEPRFSTIFTIRPRLPSIPRKPWRRWT